MFDPNTLPIPDLGLRCSACGYNLAGLPRHICPECGRKIQLDEHIPAGDFPELIFNGERLLVTDDVRELLRLYKIPFLENKTHTETIMMSVGVPVNSPGYLCVSREQYFEVIDLLRRRLLGQPMPEAPQATRDVDEWVCPACGEINPGHFELCWNCQFIRVLGVR